MELLIKNGRCIYDDNIFIFIIYSNRRCGVRKFINDYPDEVCTGIDYDNNFYDCGVKGYGYSIHEIDKNESYVDSKISKYFNVNPNIFTG